MLGSVAACSSSEGLSDQEWNDIFSEGLRARTDCEEISVVGAPKYISCEGDEPIRPYIEHLFD